MIIKFGIENFKSTGDGTWNDSATPITDAFSLSIKQSLGDTNDTFKFRIPNIRNSRIAELSVQDNINIHLLINGDTIDGANLIFNGLIKKVEEDTKGGKKQLIISGISFGEVTTTALIFVDRENIDLKTFIEACVQSVNLRNTNFGLTVDMPTLRSDGTTWEILNNGDNIREFDKSLNFILDKYLKTEFTGDGNYYWYVNNAKELVIRKRSGVTNGTLVEGVDFKTAKFSIDSSKVKNFIIIKCGRDPRGRPISTYRDNPASRAKHGFKYHMMITTLGDDIITKEIQANLSSFEDNSKYPSSYPYNITTWTDKNGNVVVCADAGEWKDAVRTEAKRKGVDLADSFLRLSNDGRLQVQVVMGPTLTYNIGDKILVTAPSYNLLNKALRVKDVSTTIGSTDVTLIEEVET